MDRVAAPAAAFFDLDKTLLAKSSSLAFARRFHANGLISRTDVVRAAYAQFVFLLNGADHDQMERLRTQVSLLVRGWSVAEVGAIIDDSLDDVIEPMVYPESRELIAAHRSAGRDIVIVSSSGTELVRPVGELLGADLSIGTDMEIADGRYTGRILFYAYGEGKAAAIRKLAAARGYDLASCYAFSDSVTDVPMLAAVGHPVATNPDDGLRRVAAQRGWPVLRLTPPPSARSPLHGSRGRAAAAVAVGSVVAVGGAVAVGRRSGSRARIRTIPTPVAPNG